MARLSGVRGSGPDLERRCIGVISLSVDVQVGEYSANAVCRIGRSMPILLTPKTAMVETHGQGRQLVPKSARPC